MVFRRGDLAIDYSDDGAGLPVVLVHAFANDRTLWRPQIEALRARFRIIAPDLRGFGGSSRVDGQAVSMDQYADDVLALLDHLKIDRAVIGGISLGGYVALSIALRHPQRTLGLILANTRATADNPDWASFREALVRDVEARGAVAVVENYGDKPFNSTCPAAIKEDVRAMILRQPATGLASGTRGMASRPDRSASLARIAVPTLIISGTEDNYIPSSEGEAMHRAIPGSTFVDIPGGGHLSNIDSAAAFNLAVASFLENLKPGTDPVFSKSEHRSAYEKTGSVPGVEPHATVLSRLYESWDDRAITAHGMATAKVGFLDIVGCIVAGAATETAAMVRALACQQGNVSEASVLGTQVRLSAPLAALANGVAGHVLDYDDMNSTTVSHPSVVLVPPILALGEARGKSGAEILSAYVLGFEVNGHFGRTMIPHHYNAGWHATSSLGIFGATAAIARLLGLDAAGMMNALAIAASNSAGLRGNFGSMTKSLHAGQAAEGALRAALLAERGFTGNTEVFDAPGGYFATYGKNAQPKPAPAGGAMEIDASGIGIKPYACCGAGVSVIDAALDLRAAHDFNPADITGVDFIVAEMATSIMAFHAATDGLQAKYCLEYCAAVALLDARGGLAQFEDERVNRSDVQQLVKKARVRSDARMVSGAGKFGVEMTVTLAGGRKLATTLEIPRGHPTRPLDDAKQLDKFLECAAPVIGEKRAREAAARLRSLEEQHDLRALIALLRP